jgi:DNA segregation ATPase FtsK/SpoIIIE-like protein
VSVSRLKVGAPGGKASVPAPVPVKRRVPKNIWQIIGVFIVLSALAGVFYVLYTAGLMRYSIFPIIMVISYAALFIRRGGGGDKQSWGEGEAERRTWFNDADIARVQLDESAEKQYLRAWRCHPAPQELVGVVGSRVMWERRPTRPADEFNDFGHVRLGLGTVRQAMKVETPPLPDQVIWIEPATGHGEKKFLKEKRYVRGMPRVVALSATKALSLVGPLDEVRSLAYAAVCQLCAWHSPEDVKVMVVTGRPELWEWVKWLPHSLDPAKRDGCGERRMVFTSAREYENYHAAEIQARGAWAATSTGPSAQGRAGRPLWVVIDDACGAEADWASAAPPKGLGSTCFIRLADAVGRGLGFARESVYEVGQGVVRKLDPDQPPPPGAVVPELPFYADADALMLEEAERFARQMGQYRPGGEAEIDGADQVALGRSLLDVVGVRDGRVLDTERLWAERWARGRKFWSFPIGIDDEGKLVEMDLKQSAEYGWNMHGVIIGHFGSGKSVSLATIVESKRTLTGPGVRHQRRSVRPGAQPGSVVVGRHPHAPAELAVNAGPTSAV